MRKFGFILSFVFSVLLVIFLVLTIIVFNVSSFSSKSEIAKNMSSTDLKLVINKIRNSGSSSRQTKVSLMINEIYSIAPEYGVKEDVIDDIFDSKITKQIISMPLGNLTDYIINGKNSKILSSDDVYNLISSNIDSVFENSKFEMSDAQKEKFLSRIKLEIPDVISSIPTVKSIVDSKYGSKVSIIQFFFGGVFKSILVCGIIVLSILIIILRKINSLLNFGVCLLITGLITIGFSFIIPDILLRFINILEISLFISSFSSVLCSWLVLNSVIIIFVSIIILLGYEILNRKINIHSM